MDALLAALVVGLVAVGLLARLRGRDSRRHGAPDLRAVGTGLAVAAVGMAVTTGLMAIAGTAHLDGVEARLRPLLLGTLVFVLSGYVEELVFRLTLLSGWWRLTGSAPVALAVSAVAAGAFHLATTSHTTALSVASSTLGGVMYGVAFVRTGRLWLPLGIHVGWNWVQGTLLGFTVSGTDDYSGALVQVHTSGAAWLGGGDYGPEGSLFSLVGRAAVIALVVVVTRPQPSEDSSSMRGTGSSPRTRNL